MNCNGQKVPDPISTIFALGISAAFIWLLGRLMSLLNPWFAVGYYGVAILIVMAMILYIYDFIFRFRFF